MTENTSTPGQSPRERLPIDEQFWPINLLLLVLGAVVSGAIVARADFSATLLSQAWLGTWIAAVWVIVVLVILAAWRLGDRSARRLQLSAVLAILLIFFGLTYFGEQIALPKPKEGPRNIAVAPKDPEEEKKVPIPVEFQLPEEPPKQLEFEKIVEVQVAPEAIARVEPTPLPRQVEAPVAQPVEQAPPEATLPKSVPLTIPREQIERAVPRQSESESQLSRQLNAAKPQAGEPDAPPLTGVSTSDRKLDAQAASVEAPRLASGVHAPSGQSPAIEASSPTPAAPPRGTTVRRAEAAPEAIAIVTELAKGRQLNAPAPAASAPLEAPAAAVAADSPKSIPTEAMRMAQRQAASSPLTAPGASATNLTDTQIGDVRPLPGTGTIARPGGPAGAATDSPVISGGPAAPGRQLSSAIRGAGPNLQSDPAPGTPRVEGRPGPAEPLAGPVLNDRRGAIGAPLGPATLGGTGAAGADLGVSGRIAGASTVGRATANGMPQLSPSGSSRESSQPHRGPAGGLPVAGLPITELVAADKIAPAGTGGGGGGNNGGGNSGGGGTSPDAAPGAIAMLGTGGGGSGSGPPSGLPSGGELASLEPTRGFGGASGARDALRGAVGGGGGGNGGTGSGPGIVASGSGAGSARSARGPFSALTRSDVPQLPGDPGSDRTTASVGTGPADGTSLGAGGNGHFAGGASGPSLVRAGGESGDAGDGGSGKERGILGTRSQIGRLQYGVPGGTDSQVAAWSIDGKAGGSGRKVGEARLSGTNLNGVDVGPGGAPDVVGGDGKGSADGTGGGSPGADRAGPVQLVAGVRGGTGTDASGPTVLVDAPSGSGGLGRFTSQFSGNVSRRAQPLSEVVVASTDARFRRRDVGGPRATPNPTPIESHGSFRERTGGTGGRGTGAEPQLIDIKVARALAFLQRQQASDGSWSLHEVDPKNPRKKSDEIHSDVAATGLALLAFLGNRHHHLETQGEYNATIHEGIEYLIKQQAASGEIFVAAGTASDLGARTYSHAIATLALCEAYGMTGDPKLKQPAQRAIDFAISTQHKKLGGWRYTPQKECDTSVTGWMFAALDAGSRAQLNVPRTVFEGVDRWLDLATAPRSRGSQYVYNPDAVDEATWNRSAQRQASHVNSAVGLYVRLTRGWDPADPRIQQGADYLMKQLPAYTDAGRNTYYWYYATQVLYHVQGPRWRKWHQRLSDELEATQIVDGPMEGSWDPQGKVPDAWGKSAGRIYLTAMNLLSLEAGSRVADSPTPLNTK